MKNKKRKKVFSMNIGSMLAILIAIFSLYVSYYYGKAEYEYKIDPKLRVTQKIGIKMKIDDSKRTSVADVKDIEIHIDNKNNLRSLYGITADNKVKELDISDDKLVNLTEDIKRLLEENKIETEEYVYKYIFIVMKNLDEDIDVSIILSKSKKFNPDNKEIGSVITQLIEADIKLYEWEKASDADKEYIGEKIILRKYKEILKWASDNL